MPDTDQGTVAERALALVLAALERADALALGPGLTQHAETAGFVRALVRESPVPVVLDADGLSAFAGQAGRSLTARPMPSSLPTRGSSND